MQKYVYLRPFHNLLRLTERRHIHPHHKPLPAQFQTTPEAKASADAYYNQSDSNPNDALTINSTLPLPNSAVRIPRLGLGVYQARGSKCTNAILAALEAGYRHIDTAQLYGNEVECGEALRQTKVPRSEIFITTKIYTVRSGFQANYDACVVSVQKIDSRDGGYVDQFLIHNVLRGAAERKMLWQVLERLLEEGKAKSIGVSNWNITHIEEIKAFAKVWPPHANQIEVSFESIDPKIINIASMPTITFSLRSLLPLPLPPNLTLSSN